MVFLICVVFKLVAAHSIYLSEYSEANSSNATISCRSRWPRQVQKSSAYMLGLCNQDLFDRSQFSLLVASRPDGFYELSTQCDQDCFNCYASTYLDSRQCSVKYGFPSLAISRAFLLTSAACVGDEIISDDADNSSIIYQMYSSNMCSLDKEASFVTYSFGDFRDCMPFLPSALNGRPSWGRIQGYMDQFNISLYCQEDTCTNCLVKLDDINIDDCHPVNGSDFSFMLRRASSLTQCLLNGSSSYSAGIVTAIVFGVLFAVLVIWGFIAHVRKSRERLDENIANRIATSQSRLKSVSITSALLAGFALTAYLDLDVPRNEFSGQAFANRNHAVVILYGAVTSLVIAIHMLALMIATCILPWIESIKQELQELHKENRQQHTELADSYGHQHALRIHRTLAFCDKYVSLAWILSTGIGIVLFAVDLPLIAFVKFNSSSPVSGWVSVALLGPVVVMIVYFAVRFYSELISGKTKRIQGILDDLHNVYSARPSIVNETPVGSQKAIEW